jgi:DNA polymerase-4
VSEGAPTEASKVLPRSILHVDMDAFFASVEIRDNPQLRGKPVLVGGGGRRGVVAAASYEARKFGCHSAQATAVALRRCPHAVVVAPRHGHYSEISSQIFGVFSEFTPVVEGLSLDEAFLDLTGTQRLHGAPVEVAARIRARVLEETKLTCSVGVAACKFVAKIASDYDKPDGLTVVEAGEEREFLAPLPVRELWGVGPKTFERLRPLGVNTIGDLARLGEERLGRALGDQGRHLYRLSIGVDERVVEPWSGARSVSCENTVEEDLVGRQALERALLGQATRLADRLVRSQLAGRKVAIKIRDIEFHTQTRQCTLANPSDQAREIHRAACELLDKIEIDSRRFRLIGVGVSDFAEREGPAQLNLLEDEGELAQREEHAKGARLQSVMSAVRERYGSEGLFPAVLDEKD